VFGISHLTRYENFGFVLVFSFWVLLVGKRKVGLKVFLLAVIFMLTITPFYFYSYRETGSLPLIYRLSRTVARQSAVQGVKDTSLSSFFLNKEFLKRYLVHAGNSYHRDLPNIFPPLVMAVAAVGLLGIWKRYGVSWREIYLCSIPILSLAGVSAIRPGARNLVDSLPFLLIFLSLGIVEIGRLIRDRAVAVGRMFLANENHAIGTVLLIVFISVSPFTFRPLLLGPDPLSPLELMEMGRWISNNLPRQRYIMTTGSQLAFYSGSRIVKYPTDVNELIARAHKYRIQYLVVGTYRFPQGSDVHDLAVKLTNRSDFKLVHTVVQPSGWANLYRIIS
jgi:hypothetical protein